MGIINGLIPNLPGTYPIFPCKKEAGRAGDLGATKEEGGVMISFVVDNDNNQPRGQFMLPAGCGRDQGMTRGPKRRHGTHGVPTW